MTQIPRLLQNLHSQCPHPPGIITSVGAAPLAPAKKFQECSTQKLKGEIHCPGRRPSACLLLFPIRFRCKSKQSLLGLHGRTGSYQPATGSADTVLLPAHGLVATPPSSASSSLPTG